MLEFEQLGDDRRNHAAHVGLGDQHLRIDVLHRGLHPLGVGRVRDGARDAPDLEDSEEGEVQLRDALQHDEDVVSFPMPRLLRTLANLSDSSFNCAKV